MRRVFAITAVLFAILGYSQNSDREYWSDLAFKISEPILKNMNKALKNNIFIGFSSIYLVFVKILEEADNKIIDLSVKFGLILCRMQCYNTLLIRLISLESIFPVVGRSMTYRNGAFQTLALSVWKYGLPEDMSDGQVRNALTSVMRRLFSDENIFTEDNYLQLGFKGHQPNLADYYSDNGSMYVTSLFFLPLGLPENHSFGTNALEEWSFQKVWSGKEVKRDYHESIKN